MRPKVISLVCMLLFGSAAMATTFVVPDDDELIAKSTAIVTGVVEGSYVQETEGIIETVYEIRLDGALKPVPKAPELLRIVSPGGVLGDRALHVEAAAHFEQGERVLLFLTRDRGRWTTTDLTLGKFQLVTSTSGEELFVRDMEDVVGWDRHGQVHQEKVRKRDGFLEFIGKRLQGRVATDEYLVEASSVTLPAPKAAAPRAITANAPFPGQTYTSWVQNRPTRWANIAAGVTFRKVASQNISGVADGGVAVIQNGLAAWTNECGSVINLNYGGTTNTPSTAFDGINVVEFNDPQSRISGSWTGSGTIGICFNSFSGTHSFNGTTWWSISDADVVFQNGYPGTHGSFPTAMTHELGHGIGWRHSNQDYATQGSCNSATQECTSAAIMNSSVNSSYGYTLRTWDINAAQSVYPGGTCGPACTAPAITSQPSGGTIASGGSRTLSVTATGTAPLSYQWYRGASGSTTNPISGATGPSVTVNPTSTTSYWVRVSNACGTVNSSTATVTVTTTPPPANGTRLRTDFNGDGRSDIFWRNPSSGVNALWFMNGTAPASASLPSLATSWTPAAFGDFNGDGRSDVFWRNSNGSNMLWLMNGSTPTTVNTTAMASGWNIQASGDFNNDGRWDVLWRNSSTGANQFWYMNGATPTVHVVATIATAWQAVAGGDFDGNGYYDVFWRNLSTGSNVLWLMSAGNAIREVATSAMNPTYDVMGSGDFNGDNRDDIFFREPETGIDIVWLMNGTTRTDVRFPTVASHWQVGAIGDFNGNGSDDLTWHQTGGNNAIWLIANGAVATEAGLPAVAPGLVMYAVK